MRNVSCEEQRAVNTAPQTTVFMTIETDSSIQLNHTRNVSFLNNNENYLYSVFSLEYFSK